MKLVLGSGEKKHKDATHVDIRRSADPDVLLDLNRRPWPFRDGQFGEVVAEDIIEHLDEVVATIEEIHRVLEVGGSVYITTPHFKHPNSWIDPTHKWHLTEHSFDYFDSATVWGSKYAYYSPCKFTIKEKRISGGNIVLRMVKNG